MANVVNNGKDVRRLGMVMEVLHDDKVIIYALIPVRKEREKKEGREREAMFHPTTAPDQ